MFGKLELLENIDYVDLYWKIWNTQKILKMWKGWKAQKVMENRDFTNMSKILGMYSE